MIALKRILIPTDFSEYSQIAVRYACEFAVRFESEVHLFHVIDNPTPPGPDDWGQTLAEYEAELRKHATGQLQQVDLAPLKSRECIVENIGYGSPMLSIIRYAKDHDIDLIAMGTHGRTGLAHVFLGSVAENVVRNAPCPVLTVRHPEHEFIMP